MAEIELTDIQKLTLGSIHNHVQMYHYLQSLGYNGNEIKDQRFYFVNGYAGTGKTTLIKSLFSMMESTNRRLGSATGFFKTGTVTSFTGRACQNLINKGVECKTIHSLFYEAVLDEKGNLEYFRRLSPKEVSDNVGDFLIVEEASMVPDEIIDAILEGTNCPVIFFGDDEQLPPIEGRNVYEMLFDDPRLKEMKMMILEEIQRTKKNSKINVFANKIRETGKLNLTYVDNKEIFQEKKSYMNVNWFRNHGKHWDIVVCGKNKTRKKFNNIIRTAKGFYDEIPEVGERIMCVQNNVINDERINNGELFEVMSVYPGNDLSNFMVRKIDADGSYMSKKTLTVTVENNYWSDEMVSEKYMGDKTVQQFVFGYALTCHKMQGSSAPSVIFYDEDVSFFLDQKAFRYTAITRASSKIMIVK